MVNTKDKLGKVEKEAKKSSKPQKARGLGRKGRHEKYRLSLQREKNKARRKASQDRHLALRKARRLRNPSTTNRAARRAGLLFKESQV